MKLGLGFLLAYGAAANRLAPVYWFAMGDYAFFLGGYDLEMVAIKDLLSQHSRAPVHDRQLAWGAKASAYRDEIDRELASGRTAVLVELEDDLPESYPRSRLLFVDHHNERAGRDVPTSLEQVFQLLALPRRLWTRERALVAANDRGHVGAMLALEPPATGEELWNIRLADRAAQGISPAEESAAAAAIAATCRTLWSNRLTVVTLPHARTATATDRLDARLGGPGFENLLVECPQAAFFFGAGRAIQALRKRWPDSFCGGELPERGFWGRVSLTELTDLLALLSSLFSDEAPR